MSKYFHKILMCNRINKHLGSCHQKKKFPERNILEVHKGALGRSYDNVIKKFKVRSIVKYYLCKLKIHAHK